MANNREQWRPVPVAEHAENYSVSSLGRVRRETAGQGASGGTIVRPGQVKRGHPCVNLCSEGRTTNHSVSRLVAEAFLGSPPSPTSIVLHEDGDNANCRASNLRWGTFSEIAARPLAKLTPSQVAEIRAAKDGGRGACTRVARQHGVSRHAVSDIWRGKTWKEEG